MSQAFRPFIADEQNIPELTVKSEIGRASCRERV